ncbi:venom serine protease 34-like [Euwallacea similis]|uniref:venom serine protease 34-like n=1 Tax=Euwallacea similis TaxID=1736056 RepID=UPI00344D4615
MEVSLRVSAVFVLVGVGALSTQSDDEAKLVSGVVQYANLTGCDCGWRNSDLRIVGGMETGINEFPAMAALINLESGLLYCGAHIISDRFLLTAAHCVYGKDPGTLGVLVGDHNITAGEDTPYSALYYVYDYLIHPSYSTSTYVNDIAIIKTDSQIIFSNYVGPICLPFRYYLADFAAQTSIILGWGQIEFSGPTSDVLLGANLQIISNVQCQSEGNGEVIVDEEVCTYADGKDSCQSDSGGPVLWTDATRNRMHLIGIISHGTGCATNFPGINTRVTSFLDWIVSSTDASYCYM